MKTEKTYTNGNISVSITILTEPMDKNIVGIILSDCFADNIGLLLDDNPNGYDLASLQVNADGKLPLILIECKIYEMLQRNAPKPSSLYFTSWGIILTATIKGYQRTIRRKEKPALKRVKCFLWNLKQTILHSGFSARKRLLLGLNG